MNWFLENEKSFSAFSPDGGKFFLNLYMARQARVKSAIPMKDERRVMGMSALEKAKKMKSILTMLRAKEAMNLSKTLSVLLFPKIAKSKEVPGRNSTKISEM